MPSTTPSSSAGARVASLLLRHLLGILFCIGVPVLITTMVPVSRLTFERKGADVFATAKTCLLFWIPFKTETVGPVTDLSWDHKDGQINRYRRTGRRDDYVQEEAKGSITIHAADRSARAQVSPHDLESAVGQIDAFMKNPAEAPLRLFLPANWKFGIIGGGVMALFIPLYVGSFIVAGVRRLQGKPPVQPYIVGASSTRRGRLP